MMDRPNAQINVANPDSAAVRAAASARRAMFQKFMAMTQADVSDLVLDVGVTSERTYEASNYLEAWYPHRQKLVAAGIDELAFLETDFPGVRVVRANGCKLPFLGHQFDIVHSSAVIEHVGSREKQREFLVELTRVSRRAVFVTTPNRWYPIEFHTLLPFAHWLPREAFERVLRLTGRSAFADLNVLNLLSARQLLEMSRDIAGWEVQIKYNYFLGLPSNLLLLMLRHR